MFGGVEDMKKYRIKSHFRFITFLVVMILLIAYLTATLLGMTVADSADQASCSYRTVTAVSGDTIWSIAESCTDGQDIRRVVYDIQEINGLDDCVITTGEHLKIPVYD